MSADSPSKSSFPIADPKMIMNPTMSTVAPIAVNGIPGIRNSHSMIYLLAYYRPTSFLVVPFCLCLESADCVRCNNVPHSGHLGPFSRSSLYLCPLFGHHQVMLHGLQRPGHSGMIYLLMNFRNSPPKLSTIENLRGKGR